MAVNKQVADAGVAHTASAPDDGDDRTRAPEAGQGTVPDATAEQQAGEQGDAKRARHPVRNISAKVWTGGAAAVVTAVLAAVLTPWAVQYAGPRTAPAPVPSASASIAPDTSFDHLPGLQDVSTMTPGQRFYATPNFDEDTQCGRPCWLPLYDSPSENSDPVTNGWPCEYYGPSTSQPASCVTPSAGRVAKEMADTTIKDSGDRLLVVCQTRQLGDGQSAQDIHNQVGQDSDIWDMVAVPKEFISSDSPAWGRLNQVPKMPGYYEAFAPDIWLGNTQWHSIPCE